MLRTAQLLLATSSQTHCNFDMNINENLEQNTIAALAGKRDLSRVRQGDIVFRKGERGDKLFSVVSGEVQLNWGDDGLEKIGPGSSFGI